MTKKRNSTTPKAPNLKTKKNTKASKTTHSFKNTKRFFFRHKLIIILSIILSLVILSLVNQKYQDWDNARMIRGLSKDFPALVEQINQATGLNLKPKANCSTTQEEFGGGVSTCEIQVGEAVTSKQQEITMNLIVESKKFSISDRYPNSRGYDVNYGKAKACGLDINVIDKAKVYVYLHCIVAVKDANTQLALDLFFPKK